MKNQSEATGKDWACRGLHDDCALKNWFSGRGLKGRPIYRFYTPNSSFCQSNHPLANLIHFFANQIHPFVNQIFPQKCLCNKNKSKLEGDVGLSGHAFLSSGHQAGAELPTSFTPWESSPSGLGRVKALASLRPLFLWAPPGLLPSQQPTDSSL